MLASGLIDWPKSRDHLQTEILGSMANAESNTPHERGDGPATQNSPGVDRGLLQFVALGSLALVLPLVVAVFAGVFWAAAVSMAVCVLWFTRMQTTCMNGGMICSLTAIAVICNTTGIVFAAGLRFVTSLTT